MSEIELSILMSQCLGRRIGNQQTLENEITAWKKQRIQIQRKSIGDLQLKMPVSN